MPEREKASYSVNQAVGKQPGIGPIPPNQLLFWGIFFIIAYLLQALFHLDLLTTIFLWASFVFSFWLLTGNKTYQYFDSFEALSPFQKTLRRTKVPWKWNKAGLPVKQYVPDEGSWLKRMFDGEQVYTAIENKLDLVTYGEYRLEQKKVGFYYNKKARKPARIVMRWSLKPTHPVMTQSAAQKLIEAWGKTLRRCTPGEDFTFELLCNATDKERQKELDDLLHFWRSKPEAERNLVLEALIVSDKIRVEQLTKDGVRKVKQIFFTATFTPDRAFGESRDPLTMLLRFGGQAFVGLFSWLTGQDGGQSHQRLEEHLFLAYKQGYKRYENLLSSTMKAQAYVMSAKELRQHDNEEINSQEGGTNVPHLLIVDETGVHMQVDEEIGHLHTTSVLFRGQRGQSSVPKVNPEWIYLPARGKYVGFMQLDYVKLQNAEPKEVVGFLGTILEQDWAFDCRIVAQFSTAPREVQKFNLERLTRNANHIIADAAKRKDAAVSAKRILEESESAQREVDHGNKFLWVSAGVFLYRNNPDILERHFADLADLFPTMNPYRERNKVFDIWLQSLPYVEQPFLRSSHDRPDLYISDQAVWMLPLVATAPVDKRGLELIATEGGTPVYLDAFSPERHFRFLLIAEPRSGKSIFMSGYIKLALLHRQPLLVFDVPRDDGTSTYIDLVNQVALFGGKAAYYEIGSKSMNLLHDYDFSHLPNAQWRQKLLWEIRVKTTVAIGIGELNDPTLEDALRDIVSQSLSAFYAQPQIKQRFDAANAKGLGTTEWLNSPTYHDYLTFLNESWLEAYFHKNESKLPVHYQEAAKLLVQKLQTCLYGNSKLGRAIAQPSDFDNHQDLLVFALTGQYTNYELRILALTAQAALLSLALTVSVSHFLADECPQLMPHRPFAEWVGSLATNGPKSGIRLGLISQYPKVIFESAAGDAVSNTLNAVLVGHIHKRVIPTLVKYLDFDEEFLQTCALPNFKPNAAALRSHWLLEVDGNYTFCGYNVDKLLLALTANNYEESRARERFLNYYKTDEVRGLILFANAYVAAKQGGISFSSLHPENYDHFKTQLVSRAVV